MPDLGFLRLVVEYFKQSRFDALTDSDAAADRLLALAEKSYLAGHADLTVRCLQRAAELAAKPTEIYAELGSLYYEQERYDKARDAFERALTADYRNPQMLRGLALSYHMLGTYDKAIYYYLAALAENPNDFESRLNLGLAYHSQGRLDDAIEQLRRACRLGEDQGNAGRYHAFLSLGKALYEDTQYEAAEASLERAITLNSADSESPFYLGLTQEAQDRPEEAAENYRRAIAVNPGDAYAYLRLANLFGKRDGKEVVEYGDGKEVVDHATRALRLFELQGSKVEQASAYWTIGWGHLLSHEWEQSTAASRAALELDPTLTLVRFNLGLALLRKGRNDEARTVYAEAMAGPVDVWDLDSGIHDLEAALREDPSIEGATAILDHFRSQRRELVANASATKNRFANAKAVGG